LMHVRKTLFGGRGLSRVTKFSMRSRLPTKEECHYPMDMELKTNHSRFSCQAPSPVVARALG
jgi:hypothetical protein